MKTELEVNKPLTGSAPDVGKMHHLGQARDVR